MTRSCDSCGAPLELNVATCAYCDADWIPTPVVERKVISADMGRWDCLENTELIGNMNRVGTAINCRIVGDMNRVKRAINTEVVGNMNRVKRTN